VTQAMDSHVHRLADAKPLHGKSEQVDLVTKRLRHGDSIDALQTKIVFTEDTHWDGSRGG